ncbi:MAG TPA: hypothetical protein VNJ70_06580 [Thermoanaerobaculia bacterium]|nr:hypothetical protein [Thermoanaerobaculia bacterium]
MARETFPFRPWVRRTSLRAIVWGVGAVLALGAVVWLFSEGEREAWGRAFGVLTAYGLLFLLTLAKIWWTAGKPAVALDDDALLYQPLHTFRPRRVPFARVLACAPRPGTEALRFVVEVDSMPPFLRKGRQGGTARELFLNLAIVRGQHRFLALLGERLEAAGLDPVPGRERTWRRPGWVEEAG